MRFDHHAPFNNHLITLNFPIFQSYWCPSNPNYGSLTRPSSTTAEAHRIKYNWIKGVETLEDYRPGGFHPVMIGDILHDRYIIVDKLGHGGYSTGWLARDNHQKQSVALRLSTADSVPGEIKALRALSQPAVSGKTTFEVEGPNGRPACYTISFSRRFSLEVARALSYSLAQSVAYTHSRDIHLSNILVKHPSSFDNLSIEQFHDNYGKPETVSLSRNQMGNPSLQISTYLEPSTAIWKIMGMKAIFSTDFVPENEIIAQHIDVLEPGPLDWWQRWEGRSAFFDEDGSPLQSYKEDRWPVLEEGSFELGIQKEGKERDAFLDLIRRMLAFRPEERISIEEVLKSEWMVEWALPDYERSSKSPH
ncbi:hypothetical protein BO70DRAFT_405311 [Aspergillus heteromorphus CBS 117.55]|uniref:non-specific serine/threonine protein kinase n=1 Tax=Aspergillus heteromorphus CBS 117.55 TaxID=1448321 RepID=A0A317WAU3_9EURO|nr:uncharacterized protein BO70DRAFT_405311 [Aspergillus heteromorphus CBS 117.55]PWY82118.1 hypothetical protein BO70DRAFT_405311 [Aspergillus heteromorphus CBS 117.55]